MVFTAGLADHVLQPERLLLADATGRPIPHLHSTFDCCLVALLSHLSHCPVDLWSSVLAFEQEVTSQSWLVGFYNSWDICPVLLRDFHHCSHRRSRSLAIHLTSGPERTWGGAFCLHFNVLGPAPLRPSVRCHPSHPVKSIVIIGSAVLAVCGLLLGCQSRLEPAQPRLSVSETVHSNAPGKVDLNPPKPLPAKQTLDAIASLPPNATLDDVLKITGKPGLDFGSGIYEYFFRLDDPSVIRVRARRDGTIISIEHKKFVVTELWHNSHQSTPAPRSAQSVSQPKTLAPQRPLPAEQTLLALRDLSPTATLDDVLKITGEPSGDIGSAIHSYGFALDDQSGIRIRAHLDERIISIEHTKDTITKLFPKP